MAKGIQSLIASLKAKATKQSSLHSGDRRKYENFVLLILSFVDLVLGVVSLVLPQLSVQILATIASMTTCAYAVKFFIQRRYERKSNGIIMLIGIIDVICGVLSVALASYSVQVIASVASGLPFFKALKIFVQSEKGVKILDTFKPIIAKVLIQVAPIFAAWLFTILSKIKNKKGENVEMDKFKEKLQVLIAYLKRNVKTNISTIGNVIASIGAGGLVGGGLVVGEVSIPSWATYAIGAVVTIGIFALTEMGVVAKGIESQEEYDIRTAKENEAKAIEKAKAAMEAEKKQEEKDKIKALAEMKAQKAKEEKEALAKAKAEADALKKEQEEKELLAWIAKKEAEAKAIEAEAEKVEEIKIETPPTSL